MDQPAFIGGAGCCICSVIIFLIILISTSLSKVETTEWALKYNWWGESVDNTSILTPGVKWTGMANYLVKFPNTNKNVYFRYGSASNFGGPDDLVASPIAVRTSDGLSIDLELEFTYQLQSEHLYDLFMLVGEEKWHNVLLYLSMGVIDNHASTFSATEFYLNRTLIQDTFFRELGEYMDQYLYMNLKTLQLQPAHFPQAYTDAIKMTQYYNTDIEVAVQEQLTINIKKETELKVAQELKQKTEYQAMAAAAKTTLSNNATVTQFVYRNYQQAAGYGQALNYFSTLEAPEEAITTFMSYLNVRALKEHSADSTMIRMPGGVTR